MCHESDVDDNAEKMNCSFAIIQITVTDKDGNPYDSKVLEEIVSYEQSLLVPFMNLIFKDKIKFLRDTYYNDKKNSVGIQVNVMMMMMMMIMTMIHPQRSVGSWLTQLSIPRFLAPC